MEKVKFSPTRAHQRYKTSDGKPAVGVTTALGIIAKPALLNWAWECGMKGEDYRKVKDQAANIGTLAHWLCECHLKHLEPDMSEFSEADRAKAENAAIKFMSWWDASGLTLVASESQLVSDEYVYGGTLDILAQDKNGALVLVDIKTSKAIYDEYWWQIAAYGKLWIAPIAKYVICRIGKEAETDDFEIQERTGLEKEWRVFLAALALYKAIKAK